MDVITLDLEFQHTPQGTAAYLVVGPEGPVLVETGPASTLGTLLTRLSERGFAPDDIRHVLVTHIHLDHAGAAGWWAQQGAQVYVHHMGARHLIDPSRLLASAYRIYGDDMDALWGRTLPAPNARVSILNDGDRIQAGGLTFVALDTPGHANHHLVYQVGDVAFTGDVAGVRMQGNEFISLPAPPPEFDVHTWQGTITRLLNQDFATIFLTHFGPFDDVHEHLNVLGELIPTTVDFFRRRVDQGLTRDELEKEYTSWVRTRAVSAGVTDEIWHRFELANPTSMSVDGIIRYWRKKAEA